ncbi:25S rRNA (adenine645-N1)-methyltransferase [Lambiella insularis]|nr:25S rRNA (adenine645-N1)-methyltransferase [Lambiella insularis]
MFAVPGWSVSADVLKTQTNTLRSSGRNTAVSIDGNDLGKEVKLSKKRKRGTGDRSGSKVTEDNLAELWVRHIEGTKRADGGGKRRATKTVDLKKKHRKKNVKEADASGKASVSAKIAKPSEEKAFSKKHNEKNDLLRRADNGVAQEPADTPHHIAEEPPPLQPITLDTLTNFDKPRSMSSQAVSRVTSIVSVTPLQQAMREKLLSSRFRYLNQTLYTTPSKTSYELFKENPTFFAEYHEGFRRQVSAWPENPVNVFVRWIEERGSVGAKPNDTGSQKAQFRKKMKGHKASSEAQQVQTSQSTGRNDIEALPRNARSGLCTIVDLGCGDAELAHSLCKPGNGPFKSPVLVKPLKLSIYSFDLAGSSPLITIADIRSLPLAESSVDLAIFCLALMGTNWIDFIEEAWRVLRWKGECWVSEVRSRFVSPKAIRVEHSVGKKSKSDHKLKKVKSKQDIDEGISIEDSGFVEDDRSLSSAAAQVSTDVSQFVEILKSRGFVLLGDPELGNKMFVRMRFTKALTPTRGKCAPVLNSAGAQTWAKKRVVESPRDSQPVVSVEAEGRVLKPCVYKSR